jgi:hypothetical protein
MLRETVRCDGGQRWTDRSGFIGSPEWRPDGKYIGPNALEEKIGIPAGVLYFSCRSVEGSGMGLANDPQQWRGGHYFLLELGTSTDRGKSYIYMGRLLDVSAL